MGVVFYPLVDAVDGLCYYSLGCDVPDGCDYGVGKVGVYFAHSMFLCLRFFFLLW